MSGTRSHISFDFPRFFRIRTVIDRKGTLRKKGAIHKVNVPSWTLTIMEPLNAHREQVKGSRKTDTGIEISWMEDGSNRKQFYSYEEIIDMKVNAIDLIENPRFYLVDTRNKRLIPTSRGCCDT